MRTIKTPLRLEAHRLKFLHLGGVGPLLKFDELNDVEKAFLADKLMENVKVRRLVVCDPMDEHEYEMAFLDLLNEWGVMCSHPIASIERIQSHYNCGVCGCAIFTSHQNELHRGTSR